MAIKLLVFDFDGTLADTKKLVYLSTKKGLANHGFKLPKNYFSKLMGNKQLTHELETWGFKDKTEEISKDVNELIFSGANKVKLTIHLNSLREIKKDKIILTNNIDRFIKKVLQQNRVRLFSEVYGAETVPNKVIALKMIMKKRKLKPSEVLYVGDKAKDWKVAESVGCHGAIIANKISWDSKDIILKANPEFVVSDLKDLKQIVDRLDSP